MGERGQWREREAVAHATLADRFDARPLGRKQFALAAGDAFEAPTKHRREVRHALFDRISLRELLQVLQREGWQCDLLEPRRPFQCRDSRCILATHFWAFDERVDLIR